jgi:hypothetical protein
MTNLLVAPILLPLLFGILCLLSYKSTHLQRFLVLSDALYCFLPVLLYFC